MINLKFFNTARNVFFFKSSKSTFYTCIIFVPNFIAALLEGFSFIFIMVAFNVLSQGAEWSTQPSMAINYLHRFPSIMSLEVNQAFTVFICTAVIMQIFRSICSFIAQLISTYFATSIQAVIQKKIFSQILRMTFSSVSKYKSGDLVEYLKSPSQIFQEVIYYSNQVLLSCFAILICLSFMLTLSPQLTLLATVVFGSSAFFQKFLIKRISKISELYTNHLVDFSKNIVQSISALKVIHIFNRQSNELDKAESNLSMLSSSIKKLYASHALVPAINETIGVFLAGSFLALGYFILGDSVSALPILLTFITMLYRLNARFNILLLGVSNIAIRWGQIERIDEMVSDKEKRFISGTGIQFKNFQSEISFKNVKFAYPDVNELAINNLNITIKKGQTVAFVGHSGAGKSSILDLLLMLYEPTQGSIHVDGKDLGLFNPYLWRDRIGVVSQDNFIFNETIDENIRFGKLDASDEEIVNACILSGAHSFIKELPSGYKTIVGERGYKLSGGERQRIALARALVRDPEILIFDEATSSLDSHSEWLIKKAIDDLHNTKTIIVVAHRLSTIVDADKIYVIEKGTPVETGTHEELLDLNKKYAFFWHFQTKKGCEIEENNNKKVDV